MLREHLFGESFEIRVQNQKDGYLAPFLGPRYPFYPFASRTDLLTTQGNNDARHCNFACERDFTLFTASLPATSVRASYHFSPSRIFFELITGYEVQSTHAES